MDEIKLGNLFRNASDGNRATWRKLGKHIIKKRTDNERTGNFGKDTWKHAVRKKWKTLDQQKEQQKWDDLRGAVSPFHPSNNLFFNMLQKVVWHHHSNWWLIALHYRDDGCVCIYIYTYIRLQAYQKYLSKKYVNTSIPPHLQLTSPHKISSIMFYPILSQHQISVVTSPHTSPAPCGGCISSARRSQPNGPGGGRFRRRPSKGCSACLLDPELRVVGPPISSRISRGSDSKIF